MPEPTNIQSHTSSQDSNVPESAVLVVCLPDEPHETSPDCLAVNTQVPVPRLLGNLIERGVAKKLYLVITLEKEVRLEALVDTGAYLTLMSSQLFNRLQTEAKRQNRTLKYQQCVLNVQSYSQNEVQLEQVAPIHLTIGPMSLVHPVYIAPVDTYPLLIGKDLLDRFEPLLDFKQLKIWAQVREPLPPQSPRSPETDCQATKVTENPTASRGNVSTQEQGSRSMLCAFQLDKDFDSDGPQILAGLQLNDVTTTDLILALWADNSAISLTLFNALKRHTTNISFANKRTRFALNPGLSTLVTAKVICALNLNWNDRCLTHYFLVLPDLPHDVYIGADLLIRLKAHVDLLNGVIWAPMTSQASAVPVNPENLLSGQTIPEACTLISEQETVIPAYTKGVAVRLNLRCGQTLSHSLGFFQPSPECVELGLTLEATPLVEVTSRALYILFNNCMAMDVRVPKAYRLGWLVSYDFQDFELVLPVIGPLPVSMIPEGSSSHTVLTVPFKIITILSVVPVVKEQDSLDCGLTDLHVVRIPTHPKAPPTFVKQYKIPLESYEPVQDIITSMLEKGVIRPCNSTYSAPIWPVLKPNGKWRPTIDYRKLNQQVPLSRWPMTQLEQEIPRIRGATIFSTLDVASGFWTIPVHPDDQHKLAFRFDNRQYTFTRCPFGYANSPAEFNIFLNKACPDARVRGNLVFVDDILLKHTTVADHLKEIDHILNQLTTAGAKIALHKGQWCKIKVNYVGLLIGPQGIEPQTNRMQAIQNIKPPANVSELRSFLGVCNYSRQFIENYSDIARPLTALLKKDCPFIWTDTQQDAMNELKQHLCTAPCLAYPDPQKEFYLDAGFSSHCLSAGLYQRHDQDRRVVAYASKTLLPPECKYSDCEKALLCTVWAIQRFSNYIGAQKPHG
ncbi:gag-pol fusion [Labeo rohita]|uniref:ribonuclease H n=1 Tax=Labeo rohita TaxID=84645 RepID=A0A498P762_LABRO|nr:gag-pol fusion [Labeo rohita]